MKPSPTNDVIIRTINEVLLLNNATGASALQIYAPVMNRVLDAVNASCSCGGKPLGAGCCPACEVWHRLTR